MPPPLTVAAGQTRTISSLVQLPFDAAQSVDVHGLVASGTSRATADVPLKLTSAGPAQQLKIELRADQRQWCAPALDGNGRTPSGALVAAVTAPSASRAMQRGA